MTISVEVGTSWDATPQVRGGSEWWFGNAFVLRFGYQQEARLGTVGLGSGIRLGDLQLDYGALLLHPTGASHRISLTTSFGKGIRSDRVGARRTIRKSQAQQPEWVTQDQETQETQDALLARATSKRTNATKSGLEEAKKLTKASLNMLMRTKITKDINVLAEQFDAPDFAKERFAVDLKRSMFKRLDEFMRGMSTQSSYWEQFEEVVEGGGAPSPGDGRTGFRRPVWP